LAGLVYVSLCVASLIPVDSILCEVEVANSIEPYPLLNHPPQKGIPGLEKTYMISYHMEKERRIFGIEMKTKEETTCDTLMEFAARGW